jgi:5-formyltetrahydrofolate cyclo-ligase
VPNPDIHHAKKLLRRQMRNLPLGDEVEMSARLVQHIRKLLIRHPEFRCISLFAALPREPDLRVLVALMPDRHFVFPSIREGVMEFHHIRDLSELELGTWGIMEPKANAEIIDPTKIDLLLCPGLAFTQSGHRLGKGKGYYDRYLARYKKERPPCYGVTFSAFVCEAIPCEAHDFRMDRVIDETGPRSADL